MKKFLFAALLAAIPLFINAQSSVIKHYGTFISIQEISDTVNIPVNPSTIVFPHNGKTRVAPPSGQRYYTFEADSFADYATNNALWLAIAHMVYKNVELRMNKPVDPDSVHVIYGSDTLSYGKYPVNANDSIVGTPQYYPHE